MTDKIEQLKKLKYLLDYGLIDQSEFDMLKTDLLRAEQKESATNTRSEPKIKLEKEKKNAEKINKSLNQPTKSTKPSTNILKSESKTENGSDNKKKINKILIVFGIISIIGIALILLDLFYKGEIKEEIKISESVIKDVDKLEKGDVLSEADISAQQAKEEDFKIMQEYLYALESPIEYHLMDYSGNLYTRLEEWHNFIGWAGDSIFYFVEYDCGGGCGCCGADIISYNLLYDSIVSIQPYRVNEDLPLLAWNWVDSTKYLVAAYSALESVMDQYNILADGPGTFYPAGTETHGGNIEHIVFEQNETEFQCLFHLSDGTCATVWSGSKETVLNGWISTEDEPFYSEVMISYLGYFQHPTNEDQLLICFLEGSAGGYENEIESRLKFVPFNSSKARKFNPSNCQSLDSSRIDTHNTSDNLEISRALTSKLAEEQVKLKAAEDKQAIENIEAPPVEQVTIPKPYPAKSTLAKVEEKVEDYPDEAAEYPGGAAAMMKWINDNISYPQTSIEMNEQGRVFIQFVVEKDGSITNVKVDRGVSIDLDREAKRLIQKMPKWVPGESAGSAVRSRCRLPINFQLN